MEAAIAKKEGDSSQKSAINYGDPEGECVSGKNVGGGGGGEKEEGKS